MPGRCKMKEPCPDCGGVDVDVWVEHNIATGRVDGFISCAKCDRTVVLKNVRITFAGPEFDSKDIEIEKIETEIVSAGFRSGDVIDPKHVAALKEWARQVHKFTEESNKKPKISMSPGPMKLRPSKESTLPPGPDGFPVIKGKGGQSFQYRRRDR